MKKVTLMLTALALVLGISQCKKQEQPVQAGEKQRIELTADNGNDGSKVNGSFSAATMNLYWEEGDVITVSGGAEGTLTLDYGAGTSRGHFSGEIKLGEGGDLVFTWTKPSREGNSEGPDFNNQAGTQDWIIGNLVLEAKTAYNESGKYRLKMEMPYAVLKLNLNALVGEAGNDVEIKVGSNLVATVTSLAKSASEEVFVAIPANIKRLYTFRGNDETIIKTWELKANTFYTAGVDGAPVVISYPEGAIKGVFTVADPDGTDSGDETKVYFSKGNLVATIEASGNPTAWKFADHQYDRLGKGGANRTIGTAAGDVDLFGWSTASTTYGISTSTNSDDYSGDLVDWGETIDDKGTWHTLTYVEWDYLIQHHATKKNVTVSGVKGYVIAPDNFEGDIADSYEDDDALAADNLLFLPIGGCRTGSTVRDENLYGYYRSSSYFHATQAYYLYFGSSQSSPNAVGGRHLAFSVRLVSEN